MSISGCLMLHILVLISQTDAAQITILYGSTYRPCSKTRHASRTKKKIDAFTTKFPGIQARNPTPGPILESNPPHANNYRLQSPKIPPRNQTDSQSRWRRPVAGSRGVPSCRCGARRGSRRRGCPAVASGEEG